MSEPQQEKPITLVEQRAWSMLKEMSRDVKSLSDQVAVLNKALRGNDEDGGKTGLIQRVFKLEDRQEGVLWVSKAMAAAAIGAVVLGLFALIKIG